MIGTGLGCRIGRVGSVGRGLLEKTLPLWKQAQKDSEALLSKRTVDAVNETVDGIWARTLADD